MRIISSVKEAAGRWLGLEVSDAQYERELEQDVDFLAESLGRLQIELENSSYRRLTSNSDTDFDRYSLEVICKLAMTMAIKNPLIGRIVNVQADYVFGRGVKFLAKHPMVQAVIDEHINYCKNQEVLYSHDSMSRQERELQVNGNLFLALATNPRTGRVTVRDIPTLEISDIIRDPDDYHNEWFYKRGYVDGNGTQRIIFYPAIGAKESGAFIPDSEVDKGTIDWNCPVHHVWFNRYGRMKFGVPEIYPSLDWALAYKRFLENWSSIMQAFARMVSKITGLGSKKQMAAAKSKLNTGISLGNPLEPNPSATAGSMGLFGKGVDVEPVKTAGATTPAKEGQPLLNMVASGVGLPNTFFGDASQAKGDSLDRPTELKMLARQRLWSSIFKVVMGYVVTQSAKAVQGDLRMAGATPTLTVNPFDDSRSITVQMPTNDDPDFGDVGQPVSSEVQVIFPELLERNVTDRVRALVNAVTQFGKPLSDIIPDKRLVCRLLMQALNIDNIESYMPGFVEMWDKNMNSKDGKPVEPTIIPPLPAQPDKGAEDPSQGGDVGANG